MTEKRETQRDQSSVIAETACIENCTPLTLSCQQQGGGERAGVLRQRPRADGADERRQDKSGFHDRGGYRQIVHHNYSEEEAAGSD